MLLPKLSRLTVTVALAWAVSVPSASAALSDYGTLMLHLKADSIDGVSNGGTVATWSDETANNNDAAQSTESLKPTYHTNVVNGKPVVRADGSDDVMTMPNLAPTDNAITIVFVLKKASDDVDADSLLAGQSDGWAVEFIDDPASGLDDQLYFWELSALDHQYADSSTKVAHGFVIHSIVFNGSTTSYFRNGASDGGGSYEVNITSDLYDYNLFKSYDSNWFGGDLAELAVFDQVLSTSNRESAECELSTKYNISVSQSCAVDPVPEFSTWAMIFLVAACGWELHRRGLLPAVLPSDNSR